jgi:hypothetical protein
MDANPAGDELLVKLNEAVAAANEAEKIVTTAQATVATAQAELVSRSKTVGLLLLEAKKLHPAVKEFEAFLKRFRDSSCRVHMTFCVSPAAARPTRNSRRMPANVSGSPAPARGSCRGQRQHRRSRSRSRSRFP